MSNVIKSTEAKTLNVVTNMLYHIHCQLQNDSNAIADIKITKTNDEIKIEYLGFILVSNQYTWIQVCYNSNKYICVANKDEYRLEFNHIRNMVKNILDKRDELLVVENYELLENGYQTILVQNFNSYLKKLNVQYQITNTEQINWEYIFNNIEDVPMDFLITYSKIIDWSKFAKLGKFSMQSLVYNDLLPYLFKYDFVLYNDRCPLDDKWYLINDWEEQQIIDVTKLFIKDRNNNGVTMDNLLDQYISNGFPIDFELLSKEYPLSAELISKYLDKLSIDNMLKNNKIECDILIIIKEKQKQNNN